MIFNGKRFDIGNKLGFLKTNILYGLQDEEIRDDLREWLIAFTAGLK